MIDFVERIDNPLKENILNAIEYIQPIQSDYLILPEWQPIIATMIMKQIDDDILKKLKEIAENDLKVYHPRRNAKSGMDCIRLTGKNPYVEQEEQKKMKVRK